MNQTMNIYFKLGLMLMLTKDLLLDIAIIMDVLWRLTLNPPIVLHSFKVKFQTGEY
mgnify:CR=1 FL=1